MMSLSPFSRRDMLRAGGAGALMAAMGLPLVSLHSGKALAKADFAGTQAPGYFRFRLGGFEISIISDGNLYLPTNLLAKNVPEAELKAFLKAHYLPTEQHMSHLNLCLLNTGKEVILVDAGSGLNFQDWAGKAIQNLEAAGYKAGDVDKIVITHGHPDHIWGIIDSFEETPRFPNAEYFINAKEWDYWTDEGLADKLPESFRMFASGARRNLIPVSGRTKRIKPEEVIAPGVNVIDTRGHTVGHLSVVAESEGQKLLVTGDAISHAYIAFQHPEWQPAIDMDGDMAVVTRKKLLDMAAAEGFTVVCYHAPFPGVGRVARAGAAYRWIPAVWEWDL